ncbi:DNA annealing helicase and endonuclease ZRANB3 [Tetrabaena socialis]|uniref:DNA annealing helicase and endonuclease ZRANB3 n=1 Tax=Tetrabaena socialis TaxID=47790 RepID=A0A2J8A0E9_9CHLO|nr:DNA annealing helicase and endonuclease ZRANB3 [Tetrabaena socialis]|eukprot:PNH06002.1 DNA annealing helicase and endonuclease ZRANB3 [Tetrabaena socialis]
MAEQPRPEGELPRCGQWWEEGGAVHGGGIPQQYGSAGSMYGSGGAGTSYGGGPSTPQAARPARAPQESPQPQQQQQPPQQPYQSPAQQAQQQQYQQHQQQQWQQQQQQQQQQQRQAPPSPYAPPQTQAAQPRLGPGNGIAVNVQGHAVHEACATGIVRVLGGGELGLATALYDERFKELVKTLPTRVWDPAAHCWRVPATLYFQFRELFERNGYYLQHLSQHSVSCPARVLFVWFLKCSRDFDHKNPWFWAAEYFNGQAAAHGGAAAAAAAPPPQPYLQPQPQAYPQPQPPHPPHPHQQQPKLASGLAVKPSVNTSETEHASQYLAAYWKVRLERSRPAARHCSSLRLLLLLPTKLAPAGASSARTAASSSPEAATTPSVTAHRNMSERTCGHENEAADGPKRVWLADVGPNSTAAPSPVASTAPAAATAATSAAVAGPPGVAQALTYGQWEAVQGEVHEGEDKGKANKRRSTDKGSYRSVICDESHALKSRTTQRYAKVGPLVRRAARAVLCTGTPLLNRPIEIWPQIELLRPGLLGSYTEYGERYCLDPRAVAQQQQHQQQHQQQPRSERPGRAAPPSFIVALERVPYIRIDGSTPPPQREAAVGRFQAPGPGGPRVALLSLRAAGQGLTLTAASTVVFVELDQAPAVLCQAEDRAHRVGQAGHVHVYYLLGRGDKAANEAEGRAQPGTLDDRIWAMLERKQFVVGATLDGGGTAAAAAGGTQGTQYGRGGTAGTAAGDSSDSDESDYGSVDEAAAPPPYGAGDASGSDEDAEDGGGGTQEGVYGTPVAAAAVAGGGVEEPRTAEPQEKRQRFTWEHEAGGDAGRWEGCGGAGSQPVVGQGSEGAAAAAAPHQPVSSPRVQQRPTWVGAEAEDGDEVEVVEAGGARGTQQSTSNRASAGAGASAGGSGRRSGGGGSGEGVSGSGGLGRSTGGAPPRPVAVVDLTQADCEYGGGGGMYGNGNGMYGSGGGGGGNGTRRQGRGGVAVKLEPIVLD